MSFVSLDFMPLFNFQYKSSVLFNLLKPKFVQIICKTLVRISKKTQHFTITEVDFLMLFKEIIPGTENHTGLEKMQCTVTDC
jgi:hypothetical protein